MLIEHGLLFADASSDNGSRPLSPGIITGNGEIVVAGHVISGSAGSGGIKLLPDDNVPSQGLTLTNNGGTTIVETFYTNANVEILEILYEPSLIEWAFPGLNGALNFRSTGILQQLGPVGGNDNSKVAKYLNITADITSGTAFTPSALQSGQPNVDNELSLQLSATTAGDVTITYGPSTGAENALVSSFGMLVGQDVLITKRIPNTWKVIVTLPTGVTIPLATLMSL
ncbi:MAG: hypothetical protein ACYDC0_16275 [Acidimicrobiales bacterium]